MTNIRPRITVEDLGTELDIPAGPLVTFVRQLKNGRDLKGWYKGITRKTELWAVDADYIRDLNRRGQEEMNA